MVKQTKGKAMPNGENRNHALAKEAVTSGKTFVKNRLLHLFPY